MKDGAASTSSAWHTTVHIGAHADAPSHIGLDAPSIDQRSLDYYLGACQVIRVQVDRGTPIGPKILNVPIEAERVLFATGTYSDPGCFNKDFAALSVELVDALHKQGVRLIGIDTPSVDLFTAESLPVHRRMLEHDMAILEGLVLNNVPEGMYELIALPLKLMGFDASPVRAVLRTL
jgi:arylformamidase